MKLLFLISTISGGGAARVMSNLANRFCEEGNDIFFITNLPPRDDDYPLSPKIKRVPLLNSKEWNYNPIRKNILQIVRLDKIIKEEKIDVAISFMGEPNFRLLMTSAPVKRIISIRNDPKIEYHGIRGLLTRLLFFRADGVVCQTKDVINWLSPKLRAKSQVIMNQVKEIFYNTPRQSSDYYVSTGRLTSQKNNDLLIEAFHEFGKKHTNAVLRIYGSGTLLPKLKSKVHALNDDNRILFMGQTDNVPEILSHAKAFILSSDYEGMPNGLLEAMAMGLPCISTDCPCGGPRSIIDNDVNGLLIPVRGKKELINALCKIEENTEFAISIANAAQKRALVFSPEFVFEEWNKFICHVANINDKNNK